MDGEETGTVRTEMKDPYEFIMGRAPVEECIPMEKVSELKFNSILDGYVFTIDGQDYFFPAVPRDEESVDILALGKTIIE